ncbi:MAG TPA: hypothetical protein VL728_17100 [Cyclobacteriaceae bacterium]|nr:hypothetical protein [Cyclobacteriaceae bacterium]
MTLLRKSDVFAELQTSILRLQGFKFSKNDSLNYGLGPIHEVFPNASFPLGAVHEFLSEQKEEAASTSGFIGGILSHLMGNSGAALWISSSRTLFPPTLKSFGLEPDRFIFVDLKKEKDVIWAMEEALKCNSLAAVVGEIREIDFTASRRLQLAVEQSQVTGFVVRHNYRNLTTTSFVSRWKISPLPSEMIELPGVGFPQWRVELLRIRNGKPGVWTVQWVNGKFEFQLETVRPLQVTKRLNEQITKIKQAG